MSNHTRGKQVQFSDTADGLPSVTAMEIETVVHSLLPLPSAAEFRVFEETCPGAGNRILTLVEKQFEHRCDLENTQQEQYAKQQEESNKLSNMGIAIGFFTIIFFGILAVILALCGRQSEAITSIVAPMAVFAIAVLKYTTSKSR